MSGEEWDARRDRARAHVLAVQAQKAFATMPLHKKELAQVDAWLAAHR